MVVWNEELEQDLGYHRGSLPVPVRTLALKPLPPLEPCSTDQNLSSVPGSPKASMWSQHVVMAVPGSWIWVREGSVR